MTMTGLVKVNLNTAEIRQRAPQMDELDHTMCISYLIREEHRPCTPLEFLMFSSAHSEIEYRKGILENGKLEKVT